MRLAAAVAVAVAAVLAVPAVAAAQPSVAPIIEPTATPTAAPTPTRTSVGIDKRQEEDPASDRAYLARTALIAPSGTVTIQARAPIAPGGMGGISASLGRVEIGVSTLIIAVDEGSAIGFNAKVQLLKGRHSALAATLDTLSIPDDDDSLYMTSLVASFCTDGDACNTLLSAHLTMLAADGEDEAPVFAGVSFSKGARTRLVGEFHITDSEEESVFGGYLGGRWGGSKLAFDAGIGFGGVVEDDRCYDDYCDDSDSDVFPWPFVGLSARM
jgi:hypothetical protein